MLKPVSPVPLASWTSSPSSSGWNGSVKMNCKLNQKFGGNLEHVQYCILHITLIVCNVYNTIVNGRYSVILHSDDVVHDMILSYYFQC